MGFVFCWNYEVFLVPKDVIKVHAGSGSKPHAFVISTFDEIRCYRIHRIFWTFSIVLYS
jgi:hypothetical protein